MYRDVIHGEAAIPPNAAFLSLAPLRPWLLLAVCAAMLVVHALPFVIRPRWDVVGHFTKSVVGLMLVGIVAVRALGGWRRCQTGRGWWAYLALLIGSPILVDCLVEGLYSVWPK